MTEEKYQELVKLVEEQGTLTPPKELYGHYGDWNAMVTLARLLTSFGLDYPQEAVLLFREAVAVPFADFPQDVSEDEYVDLMAWALRDLSSLERKLGEYELSLAHIEKAIEMANSRKVRYQWTLRGNLVYHKLLTLCALGRTAEADAIAESMVKPQKQDSCAYYGYLFQARQAAAQENPAAVRDFMVKAVNSMDNADVVLQCRTELEQVDITRLDAQSVFDQMNRLLPDVYHEVVWENEIN